jgi:hypothetical protein
MTAMKLQHKAPHWLRTVCVVVAIAVGAAVSSPAGANYNANLVGVPTVVATYEGGVIYFQLANQPSSNGSCSAVFFEIDPASNTDGHMYARLLVAYTQQTPVNVGYDNTGACGVNGYIHVYRVG